MRKIILALTALILSHPSVSWSQAYEFGISSSAPQRFRRVCFDDKNNTCVGVSEGGITKVEFCGRKYHKVRVLNREQSAEILNQIQALEVAARIGQGAREPASNSQTILPCVEITFEDTENENPNSFYCVNSTSQASHDLRTLATRLLNAVPKN